MTRSSWFTLAYALVLGAAGPLAACANNNAADTPARGQSALEQSNLNSSAQTQASSPYSDAQIQAFVAARDQIEQLAPGETAEQQAETQQRIGEILQQNNLTPDVYNAIQSSSQTNQALANRIAAASVGTSFTDAQLQSFVAASAEIDPLNRTLAAAPEAERAEIGAQIRAALDRHNLDMETYNGIAARAQTDQQLAQRIAQLRNAAQPTDSEG